MDEFLNNILDNIFYQICGFSTYVKIIINDENENIVENVYIIEPNNKPTISEKKIHVAEIRNEIYKICKDNNINFLDKTDLIYLSFITDKKIPQNSLAKLKLKYNIYNFYDVDVYKRYIKFCDDGSYSPTEKQYINDLQYIKFLKKGIN